VNPRVAALTTFAPEQQPVVGRLRTRLGIATTRALLMTRTLGLVLVLAAYWAPWVAHPSAGLAIAEIDFNEFPKFMPQVRSGELEVWREAFYLTLLAPAVGLAVWAAGRQPASTQERLSLSRAAIARAVRGFSAGRWLLRVIALGLLITPSVFNVFEAGEFQTQLRLVAVVAGVILLTPLVRRLPIRLVCLLLAVWFVAGALAPAREFVQLLPALEAIYRRSIIIGWGFWAALGGFALLVVAELWGAFAP
jgi:hypothetical protein